MLRIGVVVLRKRFFFVISAVLSRAQMLYASRLGYVRRCTEHSAEDFFIFK